MYDLVDRPVAELPAAERGLLQAMRHWVHALTLAAEPRAAVAGRFADDGAVFDAAMRLLDRESTETLVFQRPCHDVIEETEAVVLSMWRQVRDDRRASALATARLLVGAAAPALVGALRRVPMAA